MKRHLVLVVSLLTGSLCSTAGQVRQLAELTASDGSVGQEFGGAVAVSGTTIVVGASGAFGGIPEAAYVFVKSGNGWLQAAELKDGMTGDGFGYSVAIASNTIAVAAGGAVYVFVQPSGGWENMLPTAALSIQDVGESRFADSVAISSNGTTIVAGAEGDGGFGSGAAYVFVEPPGGWTNTTQPTATLSSASAWDLGNAVAISSDGNSVVAGSLLYNRAPGEAYFLVNPQAGWQDMSPTATLSQSSQQTSGFGISVATSGDTVVVGVGAGSPAGGACVFIEPKSGWADMTQTAELTVPASVYLLLGQSVAVEGSIVLAGAPGAFIGKSRTGSVFGYVKPPTGWADTSKPTGSVIASDGEAGDGFGHAVAISGTIAVIGAPLHAVNGNTEQGTAYIFGVQ
jgi:hypothetical protein